MLNGKAEGLTRPQAGVKRSGTPVRKNEQPNNNPDGVTDNRQG